MTGARKLQEQFWVDEKGARFDGALFDVPAGQVKAAIGGTYTTFNVNFFRFNNTGGSLVLFPISDSEPYNVSAEFAQVNIPVFGDNFQFPLVHRLDLEASWRHDQYHGTLTGGTSNPKLGFTWGLSEDLGATIRGSWGTSFRFANAGEYSTTASDSVQDYGLANSQFGTISIQCVNGAPPAGSAFAKEFAAGITDINGKTGCNSTPGGISNGGGPQVRLRSYLDGTTGALMSREGGTSLAPEKSVNYGLGFELAPVAFLRGLDLQATWYSVKINGTLLGFNNPNSSSLNDPLQTFHYIVPSDLGCPVAQNATPALCAPFEKMVSQILADPNNATAPLNSLTQIYWINDGGTIGTGFTRVQGVDWQASYDWDLGDLGAWNTGIVGTYYLHRDFVQVTGAPVTDAYHQNLAPSGGIPQNGVETLPRMRYRARLGWSDGAWSVTGFMDYQSHYYHTQSAPPNVNLQCTVAGGTVGGGTFPCLINNYSNVQPPWYTFDLSIGYDTGDTPTNTYLKNVGVQFVIKNIMGIHPAFQYGPSNAGRGLAAYDILKPDLGRVFNVTITKTW